MPMLAGFHSIHVKLGRRDAASLDLLKAKIRFSTECREGRGETLAVRPGIRQRAHQHVSTHSGKGVEIADPMHEISIIVFFASVTGYTPPRPSVKVGSRWTGYPRTSRGS